MIYKNKPYLCGMETNKDYIAEDFTATIPVADYIAHYRDAEKFIAFCRQCRRYNTYWACPPFTFNVDQYLSRYETALIVGTKITSLHPEKITDPIAYGNGLMETERRRTDELLLEMEKTYNGRAFFPGSCLLCPSMYTYGRESLSVSRKGSPVIGSLRIRYRKDDYRAIEY